jgi:hypothetical protein
MFSTQAISMRTILFCILSTFSAQSFHPGALNQLQSRSIWPGPMGGRMSGIRGVPSYPQILYVGMGSGRLAKRVSGGIT